MYDSFRFIKNFGFTLISFLIFSFVYAAAIAVGGNKKTDEFLNADESIREIVSSEYLSLTTLKGYNGVYLETPKYDKENGLTYEYTPVENPEKIIAKSYAYIRILHIFDDSKTRRLIDKLQKIIEHAGHMIFVLKNPVLLLNLDSGFLCEPLCN